MCVCVYLSVTIKSAAYLVFTLQTKFYMVLYGVLTFLPCGFSCKCFFQEFWRHLQVTAALIAPWRTFDGQTRQRWLLTQKVYNIMVSYRSNNTTASSLIVARWQRSFLAICECYELLRWHGIAHVILLDITQSRAMCILVVRLLWHCAWIHVSILQ